MSPGARNLLWVLVVGASAAAVLVTQRGPVADLTAKRPHLLMWSVAIGAGLCMVLALAAITRAWRRQAGGAAVAGAVLFCASVLPLVHGLSIGGRPPWGPDTALVAGFLAFPVTAAAAAPLGLAGTALGRALLRSWRTWVVGSVAVAAGVAVFVALVDLAAPPAIAPVAGASGGAVTWVSLRHLRTQWVGGRPAPIWVSLGLGLLGASSLVFLDSRPWTPGWWLAHALDVTGVLAAATGVLWGLRRSEADAQPVRPA